MKARKRTYRKARRTGKKTNTLMYVYVAGIAIVLIGLIWAFFFNPFFEVKHIEVTGVKKINKEYVENIVMSEIDTNTIISGKNIFIISFPGIEEAILKEYKQIKTINFRKSLPDKIVVDIEERDPIGIWCPSKDPSITGSATTTRIPLLRNFQEFLDAQKSDESYTKNLNCFLIDKDGVIYEASKKASLKIVSYNEGCEIGKEALSPNILDIVLSTKKKIEDASKTNVVEVFIFSPNQINFKTAQGWWAYLNPKKDIDWQVNAMKTVLDNKIPKNKRHLLKYIELRFENISYYPEISE